MRASRVIVSVTLGIAILLLVQGVVGLVLPDTFVGVVGFMQTPPAIYVAAIFRVAIGGVLLLAAGFAPRLRLFLRIFGVLVVVGGLLTPIWGKHFAEVILGWWSSQGSALVRLFATGSLVLGFLVGYSVVPRERNP